MTHIPSRTTVELTADQIRAIEREPKAALIDRVYRWMEQHGRATILGGPRYWTKDELVRACCRIERGEEP